MQLNKCFSILFKPSPPLTILFEKWYIFENILYHLPCKSPVVRNNRHNGKLHCDSCGFILTDEVLFAAESWEAFSDETVEFYF